MSRVPSVQCARCGYPIGKVTPIFRDMRQKKISKIVFNGKTIDPSNVMVVSSFSQDYNLTDVFEKLLIKNICCRSTINTEIDPNEIHIE